MEKPPNIPPNRPEGSDPSDLETVDGGSASRTPTGHSRGTVSELRPGAEFGTYKILRLLGQGGFGTVWEAEDGSTGRRVALKLLSDVGLSSPEIVERFRQEARLAASLSHPNIVFVFGAEESQGSLGIAMELMPAGTLQDRLRERGRVPSSVAVDYALQLLDGLEAAHRAGIIHRDIKPSNCFLDDAGNAKLGDFGISKSLVGDSDLTRARSFIGTPAYSSPEQIRGRKLDLRSDLYSLGATLYMLLNGSPPFEEGNPIEVVARILSEDPRPFTRKGDPVPRKLQETVLRLLAKEPSRRHQSCEELRSALLPYSSAGITAAPLGIRVVANVLDHGLVGIVTASASLSILGRQAAGSVISTTDLGLMIALEVGQNAATFLYFALQEIFWGRSLGKRLFGLTIHTIRPHKSPAQSILIRNIVFHGIFTIFQVGPLLAGFNPSRFQGVIAAGTVVMFAVICLTMRRANAFAGLHEILSGTRVGLAPKANRVLSSAGSPLDMVPSAGRAFGPYRATGVVWECQGEALLLGRDDILDRDIWIHTFSDGEPAASITDLAESRAGRLRWLQGSRADGDRWDAYEAPRGDSFVHLVKRRGPLPWGEMRQMLSTLLDAFRDATVASPSRFTLHHIWVNPQGQVRLLDFPTVSPESVPGPLTVSSSDWISVSRKVLSFGLTGTTEAASRSDRPAIPLPEHAVPLMRKIFNESGSTKGRQEITEELERIRTKPDRIRAPRRLGILALEWSLVAMILALLLGVGFSARDFPEVDELRKIGSLQTTYTDSLASPEREAKLAALEKVFAHNYRNAETSLIGKSMLLKLTPESIQLLDEASARYPNIERAEYLEARELIREDLGTTMGDFYTDFPQVAVEVLINVQLPIMLLALVFAVLLRGGLLLSLLGVSVQSRFGAKAGRLRCTFRTLVAWFPIAAIWGVILFLTAFRLKDCSNAIDRMGIFAPVLVGIYLAMRLYSLLRPERGIEDVVAGTVLTPR